MYCAITGAIYLGGAGAVILGGLYWKRGTTLGAWAAMIFGSVSSTMGIFLQNIFWPHILPHLKENYSEFFGPWPNNFPISGMAMAFIFAVLAFSTYVVVSLLSRPDKNLDFDKLFHRGKYAVTDEKPKLTSSVKLKIFEKFGISKEFTVSDKIICFASILLTVFWICIFVIGCIINSRYKIPTKIWAEWWAFYFIVNFIVAAFVTIWFFLGGLGDFKELIHSLTRKREDNLDDGYVVEHKRLSDIKDKGKHTLGV
jgi:SSS family solute:Na+ symporter